MANFSNFWDDGNKKWGKKIINTPITDIERKYDFKNILPVSLVGCDFKSDIIGETWIVEHDGVLLKHYEISEVKSWDLKDNLIILNTSGDDLYTFVFVSSTQALKADNRLYLIMNGSSIIGCDDDQAYQCARLKNLQLNFS